MVRRIHLSIDLGSGHSRGIVRGVVEAMQAHDLQWVLTSDWTEINEQENRGGSADGVIGLLSDPANLERWRRRKIPMVNVSSARATDGIVSVFSDNVAIGCVAAEFFLAKGFTRFAYVQSGPSRYAAERRAGFCRRVAPVGTVEVCEIGGGRQLRRFLSGLRPPCAIFTASDSVARHVLNTLADLRRSVPEEFSVLGAVRGTEGKALFHAILAITDTYDPATRSEDFIAAGIRVDGNPGQDNAGRYSPVGMVGPGGPAYFLMDAHGRTTRQSKRMIEALEKAGLPYQQTWYVDMPNYVKKSGDAPVRFLDLYLKPPTG